MGDKGAPPERPPVVPDGPTAGELVGPLLEGLAVDGLTADGPTVPAVPPALPELEAPPAEPDDPPPLLLCPHDRAGANASAQPSTHARAVLDDDAMRMRCS